jgi:hypothetical protein
MLLSNSPLTFCALLVRGTLIVESRTALFGIWRLSMVTSFGSLFFLLRNFHLWIYPITKVARDNRLI